MDRLTGFYDTNSLTLFKQRKLMKEAIPLSYNVIVESKYIRESARTIEPGIPLPMADFITSLYFPTCEPSSL